MSDASIRRGPARRTTARKMLIFDTEGRSASSVRVGTKPLSTWG